MPKKDYLEEHKHLVNVLLHPTPKKLKAEAKKQIKEVRSEGFKIRGSGDIPLSQLRIKYDTFNEKQKKRFPTFQSYVDEYDRREAGRLESNRLGEIANKLGEEEAAYNNAMYAQYIAENPDQEVVKRRGKVATRAEHKQQEQEDFNKWEMEKHPARAKFFRPAVDALTKVADIGVQVVPIPKAVKHLYTSYAPPGSIYYNQNTN